MGCIYTFLGLFTLAVLYPLIYVISASFSSPTALIRGKVVLLPVDPGLQGYQAIFATSQVWTGYGNSIIYTAVYAVLSVMLTMMVGYPLTRKEFPAKKLVTVLYTITMFIGGGMIPAYLLILKLHLMDTMWALILPGLTGAWNVIITRTFIKSSIPRLGLNDIHRLYNQEQAEQKQELGEAATMVEEEWLEAVRGPSARQIHPVAYDPQRACAK